MYDSSVIGVTIKEEKVITLVRWVELCGSETWAIRKVDHKGMEVISCCRWMLSIKCMDEIQTEECYKSM
jgi:hypothetical protein